MKELLSWCISVTTLSNGYFELSFHNHNLCYVAAAFLQSALPQERVRTGKPQPRWTSSSLRRTPQRLSSFLLAARDVSNFNADRFTDTAMYDWVRDKSVANKLCRRKKRALHVPGQDHHNANGLRLRRPSSRCPPAQHARPSLVVAEQRPNPAPLLRAAPDQTVEGQDEGAVQA